MIENSSDFVNAEKVDAENLISSEISDLSSSEGLPIVIGTGLPTAEADREQEILQRIDEGASLDEINKMLASIGEANATATSEGLPTDTAETLTTSLANGDGIAESQEDAENFAPQENEGSSDQGMQEKEKPMGKQPFKAFQTQDDWQRTIDGIFAEKTRKYRTTEHQYNEMLDLSAKLLGVDRESVTDVIKNHVYELEAQREGITDIGLYKEIQRLREELAPNRQESVNSYDPTQEVRQRFSYDINAQHDMLKNKFPGFDIDKAAGNFQFAQMFGALYQNPATKGEALERAYKAVFFDEIAQNKAKQEVEKVTSTIRQNQRRVAEGAFQNTNNQAPNFDVDNMSEEQFNAIVKKLKRGEKVYL